MERKVYTINGRNPYFISNQIVDYAFRNNRDVTIYSLRYLQQRVPQVINELKLNEIFDADEKIFLCAVRTSLKSRTYEKPICIRVDDNENEIKNQIDKFIEFFNTCRKRREHHSLDIDIFRCKNNKDYIFVSRF